MPDSTLNILSDDVSLNTVQVITEVTNIALTLRMSMWGEPMWGEANLGGSYSNTYRTTAKNVKGVLDRLHVVKV